MVAAEVFGVKGEDLADPESLHGGYETRVVSVFAGDLVLSDQALSVLRHGSCVRDERGELLKILEVLRCLDGAQPQAVFLAWTRSYDPEFALGLRSEEEFLTALQAKFDGLFGRFVLGVITVSDAAEDIRVNQDGHGVSCPSVVNGLAAGINRRTRASGNSDNPGAELAKPFFWGMRQRGLVFFGG